VPVRLTAEPARHRPLDRARLARAGVWASSAGRNRAGGWVWGTTAGDL